MNYNIFIYSFFYAVFNVTGAAIIKNKLLQKSIGNFFEFILFLLDVKIVLAMFFIFISMFFSLKALSFGRFSLIVPITTGINFLVTILFGYVFFKDKLALTGYLGILFIFVGIYLLGLKK